MTKKNSQYENVPDEEKYKNIIKINNQYKDGVMDKNILEINHKVLFILLIMI